MKHFLLKKRVWVLSLLLSITTMTIAQPDWTYVNTGSNHTILIQTGVVTVDGNPLEIGDFIGVFYNLSGTLTCAGYIDWNGISTAISAWGTESGLNNGFANNEAFNWKVWKASTGAIVDMTATYAPGFPNSGNYSTNGMSGLLTLTGSSPVVSFNATGTFSNVTCYDACDGSVNVTVVGGALPYSYIWSNGASTQDLSGLCAGTYTLTVTDADYSGGSSGSPFDWTFVNTGANHTVLVQSAPTINGTAIAAGDYIGVFFISNSVEICGGYTEYTGTTTAIAVMGDDSTTPLKDGFANNEAFNWKVWRASDGVVVEMTATYISGFPNSGLYSTNGMSGLLTLSGTAASTATGNSAVLEYTITQPSEIIVGQSVSNYDGFNVSTYGGNDGFITLTPQGGTSPYTFAWSNGMSTSSLNNLSAGSYTVTVADASGCSKILVFELTQPLIIPMIVNYTSVDATCFGSCDGMIDLTISGGIEPYVVTWAGIGISEDANNLCAGVYSVTVADAGVGSQAQSQIFSFEIFSPSALQAQASIQNVSCNNEADGSISLVVSGGNAPYSYMWSNGAMSSTINNLDAGTYSVTSTDVNACEYINTFVVGQPDALIMTAEIMDNVCNGDMAGSISLFVNGGTTPYTYLWSTGSGNSELFNLAGGEYSVTVTDAAGCFIAQTFMIDQPSAISLVLVSQNVACNGLANGSIEAIVTGGTGNFIYSWSNAAGNVASLTNLAPGSYSLTVTDASGCFTSETIEITEPSELTVSALVSQFGDFNISLNGASDGSIDLTVSGGTAPYFYSWNGGQVSADLMNLPAGFYSVLVTDVNGCTATYSVTLTEPDPAVLITASALVSPISCFGLMDGSVNVSVSGGSAPYTFAWSNGMTSEDISSLGAGIYELTIYDSMGDSVVYFYTIIEPAVLELSLVPSNYNGYGVACSGGNTGSINAVITGGSAPFTYLWSNGLTTSSLANIAAGTYNLTLTDSKGCSDIASVTLNQPFPLATMSSVTNVDCYGNSSGSIMFTVTAGGAAPYSYLWSNGATTSTVTGLAAGSYSATATDANGCTATITRTITQPGLLVASITDFTSPACFESTDGEISVVATGGTAPYSYYWSNPTHSLFATLIGVGAGEYSVIITDAKGCTTSATQTLVEPTALAITGNVTDVLCNAAETGAISIAVTGGTGDYTYSWSNSSANDTISSLSAGDYTVTVKDANFCELTETFTIVQPDSMSYSVVITDVNCAGNANGTIAVTMDGGVPPYTVLWSNMSTDFAITGLEGGLYTFTVTDGNNCNFNATVSVFEPELITVSADIDHITCNNDNDGKLTISVSGGIAPYTYLWSNGVTTTSLENLSGGAYTVTVQDANSCIQVATFNVTNPGPVSANLSITNLNCYGDEDGAIIATPTGGTDPFYYAWSTGVFVQNLENVTAGTYVLTVTDINGCYGMVSAVVMQPDQLVASHLTSDFNGFGVSCFGSSDGSINLSVSGGVVPYTYLWSTGATTQDISSLPAGEYSVGVIDANGCSIAEGPVLPWTYENTGNNHTIFIPEATINGLNLQAGDYIGVFYDKNGVLTCGGYVEWTGTQSAISAWGTEADMDNGFQDGESFVWNVWRSADDVVVDMTPVFDETSFPNTNTYTTNGLSGLISLSGTGPALQPNLGYFIELTSPEPLSASGIVSDYNGFGVSCNGASNGSIALDVVTCLTEYEILWSNGSTASTLSNLAAGDYSATLSYVVGEPVQSVPFTWTYVNTGSNHTIFIPSASINGIPLEVGDYIGLFYDKDGVQTCGGYAQWTGTQTAISAWGTESGENNGFADNEVFIWKVYRVLDGQIVNMNPVYSSNFPNQGQYTTNGISGLSSLTGSATISTFSGTVVLNFNLTQPEALSLTGESVNNACFGGTIGSIDLTPAGGTEPYAYSWSNGTTTQDLSDVGNGAYFVTVTDANGCNITGSYSVTQPEEVAATAMITNVSCNGNADGSINVTATGGAGSYSYSWSNGETGSSINGLDAGSYSLTITDLNGCIYTSSYTVTQPDAIGLMANVSHVTCFETATGSIQTVVSGGTAPYSYLWSTGATTANLNGILAGSYSVTVTDSKLCVISDTYVVTEPELLVINELVTNVLCFGGANGSINLNVSGGTTPYTYHWGNNASTAVLSNLSAAAYYATVTDVNGCSTSKLIFVNQPVKLVASTVVTNISCYGANDGAINLTVTGGVNPYAYVWSNGATTQDLSGLAPGAKSVIVTDANGCGISTSVTVVEPAPLTLSSTTTNVSCNGGSNGAIDITMNGGTSPFVYHWSTGATTQDINNLIPGSYSVTITDFRGCQQFGSFQISQPAPLVVTTDVSMYGSFNVSAFGATDGYIILTPTGGTFPYFYNWSSGETSYYQIFVGAGTYNVTVSDLKGCSQVLSINLMSPPAYVPMTVTLNASNYSGFGVSCFGSANGSISAAVTNGLAPYTYAWSNGAQTATISSLVAGSYTVTVSDASGATITQSATLSQPDAIVPSALVTNPLCYNAMNGSIDLSVSGGLAPYSYVWSNTIVTEDLASVGAGSYSVTITDSRGCTAVTAVLVSNPAEAVLQFTATAPVCVGDGTLSASVVNGAAPYTYNWSNGSTNAVITNLNGGTYGLTVTDANGCVLTGVGQVPFGNPLTATSMISNVSCNSGLNGSISLVIDGGTAPYAVLWNNESTNQTLLNLAAGTYSVTITDDNSCSTTYQYTVTEPVALVASSVVTNVDCFDGSDGSIDLTVNGGTAPYAYIWSDNVTAADRSNVISGNYSVTITDSKGCTLVHSALVTQPAEIMLSYTIENLSCYKSNDGGIDVSVSGGADPFTYAWSNGSTNQDLVNVKAGNYSLILIDANGCTESTGMITITQPNPIIATMNLVNPVACSGNASGALSVNVNGGTVPYTYNWTNGASTASISGLEGGNYSVTVMDANGCITIASYTLTEPLSFTTEILSTNLLCNGIATGTAYAFVSGGQFPYSFNWSNGQTTEVLSNLAAGTYTVTVTDFNNCTATESVTITQPNAINVTFTVYAANTSLGAPAIVMSQVSGGVGPYSYLWNGTVTTSYIKFVPVGSTVSFLVTDANGCTYTTNYVVSAGNVSIAEPGTEFFAYLTDNQLEITDFNVYPNPSNDGRFFIQLNHEASGSSIVQIYDAFGRLVEDYHINKVSDQLIEVSLNKYSSGVYVVRYINQNGMMLSKRIILSE